MRSARREKDIIRLNCVTDKVVQVRVNISIAEQSIAAGSGGDSLQFAAVLASNQNQDGKSGLSRSPTP